MHYVTVDSLHAYTNKQKSFSWFKEIRRFLFVFLVVFVGSLLFTNARLFVQAFKDTLSLETTPQVVDMESAISSDNSISSMVSESTEKMNEIDSLMQKYSFDGSNVSVAPSLDTLLQNKVDTYDFEFNTLPPTNRLVVASIGVDVPLVDSIYKDQVDFTQGDFNQELMNGVVKYPTTPEPGNQGNTLLFGHTSQEWREKNPYGTVFSKLPKLQPGDEIKVIREGHEYTYKVVTTIIKTPNRVNEEYMKYQDAEKEYLTLMGCYPLGRTDKRMMVIAERTN